MKFLVLLFLISCGSSHEHSGDRPTIYQPAPVVGGGTTIGGKPNYAQVNALMVSYCDSCHSGARFRGSEAALRGSSALQRVRSRTMPPPGARALPEKERGLVLAFF